MAPKKRTAIVSASGQSTEQSATTGDSDTTSTVELNVGQVKYSNVTTCDSKVADDWAGRVLKSIESASGPAAVMGMDCEWNPPWHRASDGVDRIATLQLSYHASTSIQVLVLSVVSLNGKLPPTLVSLLGDDRVAKVGANLAGDATRVVRDFGCPVHGIFDLCKLNQKPGAKLKRSISLEALVKEHCPKEMHLSKANADVRTSNWETWPLTEEQVLYASRDAALGLMAFMRRFSISPSSTPGLSEEAIEALVDLECADTAASPTAGSVKAGKRSASNKEGSAKNNAHFFQHMRSKNIKPPNLGLKDHPKGAADALAKVCVIVSGTLDSFEREGMEKYVLEHGGKVSKTVTAKVTHLVTDHGEAGPSKLAKCKELKIPVVSEDVILNMVRGEAAPVAASGEASAKSKAVKKRTKAEVAEDQQEGEGQKKTAEAKAKGRPKKQRNQTSDERVEADPKGADANAVDQAKAEASETVVKERAPSAKAKGRPKKQSQQSEISDAKGQEVEALEKKTAPSAKAKGRSKKQSKENAAPEASETLEKPSAKPRGRPKKQSEEHAAPDAPGRDAKLTDPSAEATETPIKRKSAKTKQALSTPTRRCSKKTQGTPAAVKGRTGKEISKSQTPRRSKKRTADELAKQTKVAAANDVGEDVATPGKQKGKRSGKTDAELDSTPPKKVSKKAAAASEARGVDLDAETLSKAETLSMRNELANLAARPELQEKGFSAASLLQALEKTSGLVNPAKRLLLGA